MLSNISRVDAPKKRKASQGASVLQTLHQQGIHAGSVTRNRKTGVYAVKFGAPNVTNFHSRGTDSARVWARRIEERFEGVEVVDTYDSVADWRPHRPVLFATVYLRGELIPKTA